MRGQTSDELSVETDATSASVTPPGRASAATLVTGPTWRPVTGISAGRHVAAQLSLSPLRRREGMVKLPNANMPTLQEALRGRIQRREPCNLVHPRRVPSQRANNAHGVEGLRTRPSMNASGRRASRRYCLEHNCQKAFRSRHCNGFTLTCHGPPNAWLATAMWTSVAYTNE